jgi:hypothetical protein
MNLIRVMYVRKMYSHTRMDGMWSIVDIVYMYVPAHALFFLFAASSQGPLHLLVEVVWQTNHIDLVGKADNQH